MNDSHHQETRTERVFDSDFSVKPKKIKSCGYIKFKLRGTAKL